MGVLLTMFGAQRACRKRGVAATCEARSRLADEAAKAGPGSQLYQPMQMRAAGSNPRTMVSPPETPYIPVKFRRIKTLAT